MSQIKNCSAYWNVLICAALMSTAAYAADTTSDKATTPTGASPALSTVTAGNGAGSAEIADIAQKGIRDCAQQIRDQIPSDQNTTIYILDTSEQKILIAYRALTAQLAYDTEVIEAVNASAANVLVENPPVTNPDTTRRITGYFAKPATAVAPTVGVTDISGLASVASSILALFREDITLSGSQVALSDDVLIDEVVGRSKGRASFIRPSVYMIFPTSPSSGQLFISLNKLIDDEQTARLTLDHLQAVLGVDDGVATAVKNGKTKLSAADQAQLLASIAVAEPPLKDAMSRLAKAISAADALLASLLAIDSKDSPAKDTTPSSPAPGSMTIITSTTTTTTPATPSAQAPVVPPASKTPAANPPSTKTTATTAVPTLSDLVLVESMNTALTKAQADLLLLHVESASGAVETRGSLWTFFGSAPLRYSGGAVVSYALIEGATGKFLAAGSCSGYLGGSAAADLPHLPPTP